MTWISLPASGRGPALSLPTLFGPHGLSTTVVLEDLEHLSASESWGIWLACLGMEPDVLCGALARRLEQGETLTIPRVYPGEIARATVKRNLHGEGAAAD